MGNTPNRSQLQARREDFNAWCAERGITLDDQKNSYWVVYSAGWEAAADRVYSAARDALTRKIETAEDVLSRI